ncbi:MAG: catalase family protein [Acidobacteria bacterium]|nr:catalase family protein [Acidobacteriota bacterium]
MRPWIQYDDGIEVEQPNEAAQIAAIVESMGRVGGAVFDQHRHALRNAHAKSLGILTGVLTVRPDLPDELSQGIFKPGRRYEVVARLSSAPGNMHADGERTIKGIALKVMGVEGAGTQKFLMANLPILPFGTVAAYMAFQRDMEERVSRKKTAAMVVPELANAAATVLEAVGLPNRTLEAVGATARHILGETFHTMAALRFGRYVAKVSLAPESENVKALTGQAVDIGESDSVYRDLVVAFFREQGAAYTLRVQMCLDLETMPVEDASVGWSSEESPFLTLGTVRFPMQEAYSPARRVYGDDVLSFNPWRGVVAHRPLGSIMRSRNAAYEASTRFRHEMNVRERVEPVGLLDVPV